MKKEFLILALCALSIKSYASTGSSADEGYLFLGVIGVLLILLGIVSLFDYLKKNGKKLLDKTVPLAKDKTNSIAKYLNKVVSNKFSFSFYKFQ